MKKLIRYCKDNGAKFGDYSLDYESAEMDVVQYYLDMAMPAMSICSYNHKKLFSLLSKTVTVVEEAFAMLQLEDVDSEKQRLKKQMEESGNDVEDTVADNEMVPDLKYQVNVKTRKDNVYTTGK